MEKIERIEVAPDPGRTPHLSVIWMHGLGADGHDFEPIVDYLGIAGEYAVRFVFPHAPKRKVTVNLGMVMRAWYDVYDIAIAGEGREDVEGIDESARIVEQLIQDELMHVGDHRKIVLAGFSQGGAAALHAGLRHDNALGGIFALSSYLPCRETVPARASAANRKTPVMLRHGTLDPVISVQNAIASYSVLHDLEYPVDWKTYPIAHSVSPEICADVGWFLSHCCERAAD